MMRVIQTQEKNMKFSRRLATIILMFFLSFQLYVVETNGLQTGGRKPPPGKRSGKNKQPKQNQKSKNTKWKKNKHGKSKQIKPKKKKQKQKQTKRKPPKKRNPPNRGGRAVARSVKWNRFGGKKAQLYRKIRNARKINSSVAAELAKTTSIPKTFRLKPSRGDGGVIFQNPKNIRESVRFMPGNPNANPAQKKPYAVHMRNGKAFDKNGNYVSKDSPQAHIPIPQFRFRTLGRGK